MKAVLCLLLIACAAEETVLPPLVPVPPEPVAPPQPREPTPVAERDESRCERVKTLNREGVVLMEQKRYSEAKKNYIKAIELDPADREAPAQLTRIDKLTEDQVGSGTAIEHAQSIGAARAPCDPTLAQVKKAPPKQQTPAPMEPGLASGTTTPGAQPTVAAAPAKPTPNQVDVRQDGTVIITAKDRRAQLPTAPDVQKRLAKEDNRVVGCYLSALGRDATLTGKATYKITFDKDGKVTDVAPSDNTTYDQPLHDCVGGVLKNVNVGKKLGGEVEIYYALVFSPSKIATSTQRKLSK